MVSSLDARWEVGLWRVSQVNRSKSLEIEMVQLSPLTPSYKPAPPIDQQATHLPPPPPSWATAYDDSRPVLLQPGQDLRGSDQSRQGQRLGPK